MMNLRSFTRLPSIANGYELDDIFSVIVPIARTNLVLNPSFETNTTSWTAIGGSIARVTTQQYHGAYSLAITPTATTTDGARYDTVSLTAGTTYAYSAKVLGVAGVAYVLSLETTGGAALTSTTFTATGRWQWVVGYYLETSTTTRRVTVRKSGSASTSIFYLDGVQVEAIVAGELVSTYLDGDQLGFVPNQSPAAYYWTGTPHASTSARSGLTRAGGTVMKFRDFGFLLTAIIGLGLAAPTNAHTEYARIDGGYDDYTRKATRQFTLSGQFQAGLDYLQLRANRGGLARLLDRDLIGQDQRLLLRREVIDPCGVVQTSTCRVIGKYQGGLQGNTDNQVAESVPITFTQYLSTILADGESGAALSPQASVANANYIIKRSPAGVWSAMGTGGAGGGVIGTQVIAVGLDGKVYAGGDWTSMGGVANTGHIAYWDGSAWNAMGTGLTGGNAYTMAVAPNGDLYVGGDFTAAGGVANTTKIAKWNGSAWSSVTGASTANGTVNSIAFDASGNLYIGGNFTNIGGTAANRIAKLVLPSTWSAMGTGAGAAVVKVVVGPNGDVYAGGSFTSMGGVANTGRIARWSVTALAWNALATGLPTGGSEIVDGLVFGPNAILYVAGQFATAGAVTAANIASWNGVSFQPLSSGLNYNPSVINTQGSNLITGPQGSILVGGLFDSAGTITLPDSMAFWNGGGFTPLDVDLNGAPIVAGLAYGPDGSLYVGFGGTGTATASSSTTITNPGTARSYPVITLYGPASGTGRLYSIINTTTNRALYTSLTLNAGEIATFVLTPDQLSFSSTFQGNIADTINPGSNAADFFLQPGANTITLLSASSSVTATLYFRPAYVSLDDVP